MPCSDPIEMANFFNKHFTTAPGIISSNIPPTPNSDPTYPTLTGTQLFHSSEQPLTLDEMNDALEMLDSKTSLDWHGLSMQFLKKCFFVIAEPVKHIFNLSLSNGVVPDRKSVV